MNHRERFKQTLKPKHSVKSTEPDSSTLAKQTRELWQFIETGKFYLKHFVPYIEKYDWFKSTIINRVPVFSQAPLMRTVVQSISSFRDTAKARVFTVNLHSLMECQGMNGIGRVNSIWPRGELLTRGITLWQWLVQWIVQPFTLAPGFDFFRHIPSKWLTVNWKFDYYLGGRQEHGFTWSWWKDKYYAHYRWSLKASTLLGW